MVIGWSKTMPVPNVDFGGRRPERRGRRRGGDRDEPEQQPDGHAIDVASGAAHQSAHASPAIRTIPSPFWPAPSSPFRDSAQPGP